MDPVGRQVHHRNHPIARNFANQNHQAVLRIVADLQQLAPATARRQRRIRMSQRRQSPQKLRMPVLVVTLGRNRIPVEKRKRMVVTDLLPRVEQRQPPRHDKREERHHGPCRPQTRELRTVPTVLVVVGREAQAHGPLRITVLISVKVVPQRGHTDPLGRHVVHQMVHLPRIARIEGPLFEEVRLLGLGQQKQIRFQGPKPPGRRIPEGNRNQHRHVAPETVDAVFPDPELHRRGLVLPHARLRIVEFGRVAPVARDDRRTRRIPLVPRRRAFAQPPRIPRRVVGHPVQQHLQSQPVRLRNKGIEIGQRPQLRIHRTVVPDRIVGPQRPLARLDSDRTDRHQPHGINTQLLEKRQLRSCRTERPLRRQLTHVHLINHCLITPFRMQHVSYSFFVYDSCPDSVAATRGCLKKERRVLSQNRAAPSLTPTARNMFRIRFFSFSDTKDTIFSRIARFKSFSNVK